MENRIYVPSPRVIALFYFSFREYFEKQVSELEKYIRENVPSQTEANFNEMLARGKRLENLDFPERPTRRAIKRIQKSLGEDLDFALSFYVTERLEESEQETQQITQGRIFTPEVLEIIKGVVEDTLTLSTHHHLERFYDTLAKDLEARVARKQIVAKKYILSQNQQGVALSLNPDYDDGIPEFKDLEWTEFKEEPIQEAKSPPA